jgi:TP901 family phage tail tape measure protein
MSDRSVTVRLKADISQYTQAFTRAAAQTTAMAASLNKVGVAGQRQMADLNKSGLGFKQTTAVLGGAAVAGTAVATAFGYAATKAIELDKAMRNVNSISHLGEKQLAALSGQVVELSKALPQSASTLAAGLYDIASSGFQGADGLKVLSAAATSASAGMTDTATASKAITAVLNAYNLHADQAANVSDELFQTVQVGVTTFEQLAHNVGDYIGQAQALGVSFDQTGSAIAALTLTGTNAAQAGTALGSVYNALIKPQDALQAAIEKTGYASATSAIDALGFRGVLMKLREGTDGSAESMGALFQDTQALRSALQLTSNGGEKWAQAAAQIEDPTKRAGAAQSALAEQSKSVAFQLDLARNRMDAAALALGGRLLPVLNDALGAFPGLGADAAAALEPLKPLIDDMWKATQHLVDIGGDAAGTFGPLVLDLAHLAAVPVVGMLTALAQALESVTGLLADHETLVTTLAVAYGITLAGGVARVVTAIGVGMVVALDKALVGLGAMSAGVRGTAGSLNALAAAEAAATLGISAVIAEGVMMWSGYSSAASKAEDVTASQTAMGQLHEMEAFIAKYQDRGFWANMLHPVETGQAAAFHQNLQAIGDGAYKAQASLDLLRDGVNHYIETTSRLSGDAADDFHNKLVLTGKAFTDMIPTLQAAGVQVGDSFDTIRRKIDQYKASTEGAAGGQHQVVAALQGLAAGATTTAAAVDKLSAGLNELLGVFLSQDEAASGFEQSLADMKAAMTAVDDKGHRLGLTFDLTTQRGRDLREAVRGGVEALEQKIEADARAGVGSAELSKELVTGRDRLIAQAEAAGMPRAAMEKLLAQYKLTPALVKTIVDAVGVDPAIAKTQALQRELRALHDKTIHITAVMTAQGDSHSEITAVARALNTPPVRRAAGSCATGAPADSDRLPILLDLEGVLA